ncbi:glycosyltransferase family 2 protein [Pseudoalteromonas sp. MMG012]|uniref:glycosyltransferase family 2 protein n=1 Tax=Pseudoalteromonas sp. MMG012 TaxID=2822686 RepID=UPI001B3A1A8C|nr:glycosyltransferase family 2 protein [Pseudoalteromonas sp. MMG012]MBQ4851226.1 glycosyltransferase family 2 protein [Pseudoalteromonas sp. MMG012]
MSYISAVIICKNEQLTIGRYLRSVSRYTDEIIIVDTGSTDKTLEIANEFDVKIHHYEWNDDFSAARNFALSQATSKWLLILDVDELIEDEDILLLYKVLESNKYDAIDFQLSQFQVDYSNIDPKAELQLPNVPALVKQKMAVIRNGVQIRYEGCVHETIVHQQRSPQGLNSDIRCGHYRDSATVVSRALYYSQLESESLTKDKTNSNAHFNYIYNLVLNKMRQEAAIAIGQLEFIDEHYKSRFKDLVLKMHTFGWLNESSALKRKLEG